MLDQLSCEATHWEPGQFVELPAGSFWNSDTLDAIVESALIHETIEYWIRSSDLPQNINIHGANTAVKFVFL